MADRISMFSEPPANGGGVDAISRLYEDILWRIFMENTLCPPDSRPLMVARHSSQVCRRWRAIILRSSTIWGRLISLKELWNVEDEWRDEVVARTGCALLWVHNHNTEISRSESLTSFLFNLLRQHWERIQILKVTGGRLDEYQKEFWTTLFEHPAPKLKIFYFTYYLYVGQDPWILPSPLFNNAFPQLKYFSVTGAVPDTCTISIYMPESWLRRLRTLILRRSTVVELVGLLRLTPLLEELETITHIGSPIENDNLPKVLLPRLKNIRLGWRFPLAIRLLTLLVPSEGCSLQLPAHYDTNPTYGPTVSQDWMVQAYLTITKYAVSYCEQHRPTAMSFYYNESILIMKELNTSQEEPKFHISAPQINGNYSLIEMLLTSCLASVREFHLSTTGTVTVAIPSLYSLLPFYSATTLSANIDTLVLIQNHWDQDRRSPLFPQLQTLKMESIVTNWRAADQIQETVHEAVKIIEVFFKLYADQGVQITAFDICQMTMATGEPMDFSFLENFKGLLFKWAHRKAQGKHEIKEYTCGTGQPSELMVWHCDSRPQKAVRRRIGCKLRRPMPNFGWSARIGD